MNFVDLEKVCDIQIGKTPSRSRAEYWDGSLPWVTIGDFASGRTVSDTKERITAVGAKESGSKVVPKGTLLLSFKLSLGKRALAGVDLYTNEAIAALRIRDESRVCRDYLYWALGSLDYDRLVDRAAKGKTLNKAKLRKLRVPLPVLAEQKRIAAILDTTDALRAKRRESIAQLDALLQSTFLHMFGDPIANPHGFPVRRLQEFYASPQVGTRCGPFGSALKSSEIVDVGVAVLNMDNIDPGGRMMPAIRMHITAQKYEQLRAYSVLSGDIIISRAGTVGKMCVVDMQGEPAIISTNLIRLRLSEELLPIYFVALMTYCKGRLGRLKTGPDGAFTHMNTGILDKLAFPYPPIDQQRKFAHFVEAVVVQKKKENDHLAELDALFASLQQRAFTGELLAA